MNGIIEISFFAISFLIFLFFQWAAIVSKRENEIRAALRFYSISIVLITLTVLVLVIESQSLTFFSLSLVLILLMIGISLFIPVNKDRSYVLATPKGRIDERDTMFSRLEL